MKKIILTWIFVLVTVSLTADEMFIISMDGFGQYPLDKSVKVVNNESLNQFIRDLKEVIIQRDTTRIRDFLAGRPLEMFDSEPKYYDWTDEYFGSELHKKNSAAWGKILKAIEVDGAEEWGGWYTFPWYEEGFIKYLGTCNERIDDFENRIVEDYKAGAVIGENVNLRSAPSMNASVICKLSWEAIRVDREFENEDWVKISTLDYGKQGYVSSKYIFGPYNLRVTIAKDIVMYQLDNKRFTWSEIFKYLLTEKNMGGSDIDKMLESEKYTIPKELQIDRGWKIIRFREWE